MPRNGVSTNKINWFTWPARNEKFVWGSIGHVTLPFLFSLLRRVLNFVHPDSYISVYQLSNSVTHEGIGEYSLKAVSGLKKTLFVPKNCSIGFVQNAWFVAFCQLWIIITVKRKQICILFTRFHTFQTFLCLVVPITNRLEKNR